MSLTHVQRLKIRFRLYKHNKYVACLMLSKQTLTIKKKKKHKK